ncbi:MAG: hypothetical protein ABJG78_09840 [Cyclobacteriaceae bacterium]
MQQIINQLTSNPKVLFLLDGVGAFLSAILLGVVLVQFESVFGMPKPTLYFLALFPCIFLLYDLWCYFQIKRNGGIYIKVIAIANLLYCCLSIGLVVYHFQQLTQLGLIYFLLEFVIILFLVRIELKIAAKLNSGN